MGRREPDGPDRRTAAGSQALQFRGASAGVAGVRHGGAQLCWSPRGVVLPGRGVPSRPRRRRGGGEGVNSAGQADAGW